MIKQVQSFKSSDGALHETKIEALEAEYRIELQGAIQRIVPAQGGLLKLSPLEIARVLKTNSKEFRGIMQKYDEAIRRATAMPKTNASALGKK